MHLRGRVVEDAGGQGGGAGEDALDPVGRVVVGEAQGDHLPSLADDPGFLAALDDLDRGVFGFLTDARKVVHRPPLIKQLVVPGARANDRIQKRNRSVSDARRRTGISVWAASWIILAALTGASAAGLMFHSQLSEIMLRWEGTGREKSIAVLSASVR